MEMSSFVVMDVALYLLVVLSVAGFSWEVAYGKLSEKIKSVVGLDQPKKYGALLYIQTWKRAVGNFAYALFPSIFIFGILPRITHQFIYEWISCPYCQSVWYMFAINFFLFSLGWGMSLLLSCITMIPIAILDRLKT